MDAPRVLGIIVCDLERAAIGTRSRLADSFQNQPAIKQILARLLQVRGVQEITLLAPERQISRLHELLGPEDRLRIAPLIARSPAVDARIRTGRAWNLLAWRGGAGQFTAFDEEYHPAAIASASAGAFGGSGAEHVLVVPSHAVFLDPELTSALVHHHLHKNHEMRVTYTPAAPGLSGMMLRADIVREMGEKSVMPWQLLAYDPNAPSFDTLIREACMQVDPALSKIPNRFCVDTQRSWDICQQLVNRTFSSLADLCLAAARGTAPGVTDLSQTTPIPREVEIELAAQRLTTPPGTSPHDLLNARGPLDSHHWVSWFGRNLALSKDADDVLFTFGGAGDPLLYEGFAEVLAAARTLHPISIALQTDLATTDMAPLIAAIEAGLIDIVTVTMYGHTAETYARVAGADLHATVMQNMELLAKTISARGGMPLMIPRLLKVRDTIPELEPFFDFWIQRAGWAVIDAPTDLAGSVEFSAVVDMAPPRRKPCRRIWDRMIIRADGRGVPCDQDIHAKLTVGSIESMTIPQMWKALQPLRDQHANHQWQSIDPCKSCREWHRP